MGAKVAIICSVELLKYYIDIVKTAIPKKIHLLLFL